jgi:iron complex transport system permease protein
MTPSRRQLVGLLLLALLVLVVALLRLTIDRAPGGPLGLAWPEARYAWVRWNALIAGASIGAALGVSGVLLQALLRNPLASPFILGLSSGAGLGVMISMYVGYLTGWSVLREGTNAVPALLGALATLGVVYGLGQRRGWPDPLTLVLVGVVVSAICGAAMMALQRLVPGGLRGELAVWMMGNIPTGTARPTLAAFGLLTIFGLFIAMSMGRAMDVAAFGDDEARSIGLHVGPLLLGLFALAGALTAASVALAGPVAFVGLIAPHAARIVLGPRHTPLVPGAALCGVLLVVGADAASQAIDFGIGRMPVGVFTALIGGPAFIWLLRAGRGMP